MRQNYMKASHILKQVCFNFSKNGWKRIDSMLMERYAICQKSLGRTEDLLECYVNLLLEPSYLSLEEPSFYLSELIKCCQISKEFFKTYNQPIFKFSTFLITDSMEEFGDIYILLDIKSFLPEVCFNNLGIML